MARRWNESNHPRHDDGRFKDKLGGGFAKRLSDQIGAQRGEPEAGTKGVHRYSVEIRDGDAPTARMMQNRIANRLAGQSSYFKDSRATFVGVERSGRKGNYKYDVKITGSGTALPPEELQRWTGGAAKRLDAGLGAQRGESDGGLKFDRLSDAPYRVDGKSYHSAYSNLGPEGENYGTILKSDEGGYLLQSAKFPGSKTQVSKQFDSAQEAKRWSDEHFKPAFHLREQARGVRNKDKKRAMIAEAERMERGDGGGSGGDSLSRSGRDQFNREMLEEIDATTEDQLGEDQDLEDIANELETAIKNGDTKKADALANEGRRYMIANGYHDDGDLPMAPDDPRNDVVPGDHGTMVGEPIGGSGVTVETIDRRSTARDAGNVETDRGSFVLNMLGEGNNTLDLNDEDDETEQDDDLAGLVEDIETEMAAGRTDGDRALALAKELRRYLIANEYVEDDEITDFDDSAGKPGFAQRISDQIGQQRGETPSGGPRPGDRDKKLFTAVVTGNGEALDRASADELKRLLDNPDLTPREQITVRSALARRGALPAATGPYQSDNPSSPMPERLAAVWQKADRTKLRRASTIQLKQMLVSPGISDIQKILIRQVLAERGA